MSTLTNAQEAVLQALRGKAETLNIGLTADANDLTEAEILEIAKQGPILRIGRTSRTKSRLFGRRLKEAAKRGW